ncbi:MAG TPA: ATP-binding protein [Steroidobacteraceae bacterium]|jgi:signal transduction histidine kinase|nr:ATP-binding protein [Steroidobacteraceae bacterium]
MTSWGRLTHSSALTWALGYVLLGLAALAAFAVTLWYTWNVTIFAAREELLLDDAQRLVAVYAREGVDALTARINERLALQIAGERALLLTDSHYHRLAGNLEAWPPGAPAQESNHAVTVNLPGHPAGMGLVQRTLPGGYHLLVGRDLALFQPLERRFAWGLTAAVTFLFVVGLAGALLMRRQLLSRVQGIRTTASAIMAGDLRQRLPASGAGDELDTLSQTINGMLDHIERLIHGISDVSNSIAHDLRTPLAELRSRLEVLSLTRPSPAETFSEVEGAVADVDRVMRIFAALLRLAELDTGARRSGFVQVDASKVAAEVVEFYEPAAEQKGVAFSFESAGEAAVAGDPVLIAQALSNLIDNSLKCVPERGVISVRVGRRSDGAVEIAVTDNGPGIAAADKPKVTERFFRGDASRGTPGVGLGLSIVDAVAKLHGGVLELLDNHPGLRARMVLPVTDGRWSR